MKKYFAVLSLVLVLCLCGSALAEGMGVQVIGGPETKTEPVSLDDLKLNAQATIENYGDIVLTSFEYANYLGRYFQGNPEVEFYSRDEHYFLSGNEAEYAILRADITNIAVAAKDFLEQCEVKVVFNDIYEYAGWCFQYNYDNGINDHELFNADAKKQNVNWVVDNADRFAINPMYQGHYCFGCTLPNAVVNSKQPLRMVITIDGNELTYNIRK